MIWSILMLIGVMFFMRLLLPPPESPQYTGKPKKTWCPMHKYEYRNDRLVCTVCNKTPEQICGES